jgi:hypothetical protein
MFVVDNIRVSFHHNVKQEDGKPVRGSTVCVIERPTKDGKYESLGRGFASCKNDQFNKAIGRKIALTRALQSPMINGKQFRTKVWNKYFEMTKFPR